MTSRLLAAPGLEAEAPEAEARATEAEIPEAEALAAEIARFPQTCVRADRRSAINHRDMNMRDALISEWYNGREALIQDGVDGAGRFAGGLGRHGDFKDID